MFFLKNSFIIHNLTTFEFVLFAGNIALFFITYKLFLFFYKDNEKDAKIRTKIAMYLTGVFFILQLIFLAADLSFISITPVQMILEKISYSVATIYIIMVFQAIVHYMIKKNFGEKVKIDNKDIFIDAPASRMWSIISIVVSFFILVYINIQIWSAASLMETTGIVGMTLGALALTNSVWFPDIYNGFILLKNSSLHVGDVVQFNEEEDIYLIHKTSFFQLALLNIIDYNRTFVPNNILKDAKVHNLSRLASSNGLKRTITYNIGYPKQILSFEEKEINEKGKKEFKEENIRRFIESIRKMANDAYENIIKSGNEKIKKRSFEVYIKNTGDYAIEFVLVYHIEQLPKSFVVSRISDFLIKTKYEVNEEMLIQSYIYNIDLSTPLVIEKK